jgi:hypothetical protein
MALSFGASAPSAVLDFPKSGMTRHILSAAMARLFEGGLIVRGEGDQQKNQETAAVK